MKDVNHPEETCQRCSGLNVAWHAPSPLWNAVMRWPDGMEASEKYSIVCPVCFVVIAEGLGIVSGASWCLNLPHGGLSIELKTVSPDGRLWDPARCLWIEATNGGPGH